MKVVVVEKPSVAKAVEKCMRCKVERVSAGLRLGGWIWMGGG
ncbi:MAG: hypothetical protein QXG40_04845 [Ignisphaera sp.]